mmetsp:Transcript_10529/g.31440  ORF Transcript_10529/g.31440 Transcript_10529/m.31440 type:complete len:373 (+) Transcript_10529:230-1348(+)
MRVFWWLALTVSCVEGQLQGFSARPANRASTNATRFDRAPRGARAASGARRHAGPRRVGVTQHAAQGRGARAPEAKPYPGQTVAETKRQLAELASSGRLRAAVDASRGAYAAAQPFPHTVIDGLFPDGVVRALLHEIPETPDKRYACFKDRNRQFNKCYVPADANSRVFGPHTKAYLAFVRSPVFLRALETLTGFGNASDPRFGALRDNGEGHGDGIHVTGNGGLLKVHADFNEGSPGTDGRPSERRVNTFLYLAPDWRDSFGGHLELWNKEMTSCVQRIKMALNRFVAFTCTDFSYHGHPEPMTLPFGRARRSIAVYYYTDAHRDPSECEQPEQCQAANDCRCRKHSTLFQESKCGRCASDACGGSQLVTA